MDERLKDGINSIEEQICQNLEQLKSHMPCETSTVPESNSEQVMDFLQTLQTPPSNEQDLPSYFFLFCMKLLHTQSRATTSPLIATQNDKTALERKDQPEGKNGLSIMGLWAHCPFTVNKKRLIPALKCSLSLGFAVMFGLHYSKPNGFWAGLPVGISLAVAREATFKVTNVKFQGTVIGNVYGVLGCFVFERFVQVRFLALLPWFIFTSFLQQSKMYGQAGAVSAAIGAVLILGRKNFGPPSDFAVARIVETFIGLCCAILVELLLQPTRAVSLSKTQLSRTLGTLQESLASINLLAATSKLESFDKVKDLKLQITELEKYVAEAEVEPSFWFIPFHAVAYRKLLASLLKMVDLLLFMAHAIGSLDEQVRTLQSTVCSDAVEKINSDLKLVGKITSSSVKSFQEISSIESLTLLDKELVKRGKSYDVELGKLSNEVDQMDHGKITNLFLEHLKQVCEKAVFCEDDKEGMSHMVLSFTAMGFCISSLINETCEVEKGIKDLVQWENPKSHINFQEISCKIHALYD